MRHIHNSEAAQAKQVDRVMSENVRTISELERSAHLDRHIGECVADWFAAIVGSWSFIIAQSILLGAWVTLNTLIRIRHWDPYPFTFLNLALSFQAAYASPIIMMSQNRQGRLSERRNRLDLQINLLAEQESTEVLRMLRSLCEKMGVEIPDSPIVRALQKKTKPDQVAKEIEAAEEKHELNKGTNGKAKLPR